MRKAGITLLLIFCFLSPEIAAGSVQRTQKSPPDHYEDYGACPFECCTYRRWSVKTDTVFYRDRSDGSRPAFNVKKGEHVMGITGVVITLKPGKVVVKKAATLGSGRSRVRVKAGDVLHLLHYQGEGFYKFWFNGRIYEAELPSDPDVEPQTVWWVKVRNERGQIGWSKQDDHFDDMDACG
jgi:hypothetical protein